MPHPILHLHSMPSSVLSMPPAILIKKRQNVKQVSHKARSVAQDSFETNECRRKEGRRESLLRCSWWSKGLGVGGPSLSRGILSTGRPRTTTHWQKRWLAYDSDPAAPPLTEGWMREEEQRRWNPWWHPSIVDGFGNPFHRSCYVWLRLRGLESHKGLLARCGQ